MKTRNAESMWEADNRKVKDHFKNHNSGDKANCELCQKLQPTHTPTPWKDSDDLGKGFETHVWADGTLVASCCGIRRSINAAYIVRAVNAYQPICEALKEAEKIYSNDLAGLHVVKMVWEAIAQAEGTR